MKAVAKKDKIVVQGVELGELNPLPVLKDIKEDKEILTDGTLTDDEKVLLGKKTGVKVLPYLMQNRYSRDKKEIELDSITLENNQLKATFLPSYGGRLYSLYNKVLDKELLFKNPVIQPGNLAIRDAWLSGGIEWNIGRVGHSVTTSDNLFVAILKDEAGNDFVRMYEYERQNRLYWQIDFHLPEDAQELWAYVRVVNPDDKEKHLYWWTNIALPLTEKTRVFSDTDEVFYIKPFNPVTKSSGYGHARLPYIESIGQEDITYPENIKFGSEYFFQNGKSLMMPWEAAVYEDGHMFFEASTQPLRIRKMFTWGNTNGGKNWQDFLSLPDQGAYVEIQGGLAPSQIHGYTIGANEVIDFTQVFSASKLDTQEVDYHNPNYTEVAQSIRRIVHSTIQPEVLQHKHNLFQQYSQLQVNQVVYTGSEFAKIESLRSGKQAPQGMKFDKDITENLWAQILTTKTFPEISVEEVPQSYMTDLTWKDLFETLQPSSKDNWAYWYYYSIFLFENDEIDQAIEAVNYSIRLEETPWAIYTKGLMRERQGQREGNMALFEQAYVLGKNLFAGFVDKLMNIYIEKQEYQKAYNLYVSEADRDITGRWLLSAAKAGMEIGDMSLAEKLYATEVSTIREGENNYTMMWFEYYTRKYAQLNNLEYSKELQAKVCRDIDPPKKLDYRMNPTIRE